METIYIVFKNGSWVRCGSDLEAQEYRNNIDYLVEINHKSSSHSDQMIDREGETLKQSIQKLRSDIVKSRSYWNFPNEHYIEATGMINVCDQILEWMEKYPDQQPQSNEQSMAISDKEIEKEIFKILSKTLHFMDHDRWRVAKKITKWLREQQHLKIREVLIDFVLFLNHNEKKFKDETYSEIIDKYIESRKSK